MSSKKIKLIVILGPTASGKSDLAVELAQKFNGEIVSADSRQVYRDMDIGTGKITKKEMREIPHCLLNVASPKQRFTVARYKKLALAAIKKIQRQEKLPILCGGTGFYIQAVTENITIPDVKPNWQLRKRLEKKSAAELFTMLKKLDPHRAKNIDRENPRRLIRAIEIVKATGRPVPELKFSRPFDVLILGVKKSPAELKKLIATRLKKRLGQGLVAEVKKLKNGGLSWKKLDAFGLEYRWTAKYLQRKIGYADMTVCLQKDIGHYAKRQMIWFKKYAPQTHWVKNKKEAARLLRQFLRS